MSKKPQSLASSASPNVYQELDYKNAEFLKTFMTPQGKIASSRQTGMSARSQRKLAREVKRARILAIVPFVTR
ncbi:MAG: 30S ribosomal protein S18 [Parcubacteria group bacterium SW_4_49_11]|jgi:small subunit ribosomal protein S18|nr:MAG: 30S ribosomal protein S18 [Parcubacteria group bacterium SW_4_49_11]